MLGRQCGEAVAHRGRDDPELRLGHLVGDDDRLHFGQHGLQLGDETLLDRIGQRAAVLEVHAIALLLAAVGLDDHGLGVGRGEDLVEHEQMLHVHAAALEALAQLVALPVVADGADGVDGADLQGGEVGGHRAGGAGAVADADDLEGGEARFEGRLVEGRVNDEVLVEEEVTEDREADGGEGVEDFEEAVGGDHGSNGGGCVVGWLC